ncbi:small ribosomal subunit biogenesis GTPase RsgA [Planktothrix paucivesiculata]|uniref:Small ribosomal subunit biogenesis GTPase RsgA n=1 Tax=Planktothrix paucivesiculata PCC 9631 TaxID=671071 RepID=A0A7Z9E2A2_9CYAN|nr:small ribosomal subunit biogenesis GTPase RsgA [Planktothrix paucivesiculata]VXD23724.1 putative ribosome biogenesis GTPase RsgA 1 [Planktothrix paucivesiculata PCC 9631]
MISDDSLNTTELVGTVVAVQANFYQVQLESDRVVAPEPLLLCTRRSLLKKMGQQVMVGDRVVVEEPDWSGKRGAIARVFPRITELSRPPIANANQILLVFAIAEPELEITALSRFLVKAESTGLEVCLCLNKCDLVSSEALLFWRDRLLNCGYYPLFISVNSGLEYTVDSERRVIEKSIFQAENTFQENTLLYQLKDKTTVISGPSGVGKSSLINQLIPSLNIRVATVSGKLGRGRHTTRHVELFQLPTGGLLADTPGFNQPELECHPEELVDYFPEAKHRFSTGKCQFSDCSHRDEPNCIVRGDWERYPIYLEFLETAIEYQEAIKQQPDIETNVKSKTKLGGKQQLEPKLASKKYRRSSRRFQHQTLQDLCEEFKDDE